MPVISDVKITLGYKDAEGKKLLKNLSGVAAVGDYLWTVSDEGRMLECLKRSADGYVLKEQFQIDQVFDGIPGTETNDELDLESIDIAGDALWLAGSHCRVRVKPLNDGAPDAAVEPNSSIIARPSRTLFGKIQLKEGGGALGAARALPFADGPGSLRAHLAENDFLKPFLSLPSKENGLDIEGVAVINGAAYLGLRGPLIDSFAVAVEVLFDDGFQIRECILHFIDLEGLGIRDLARDGTDVLLIAGPVSDALGPFKLFRWKPQRTAAVQTAKLVFPWPSGKEKPEGLCVTKRGVERGAIILYDSPSKSRIVGKEYSADWLPLP